MRNNFEVEVAALRSDNFQPFGYLKVANELLSNPVQERLGRELIIRALNERAKFDSYEKILKGLVRKAGLYPYLLSEFDSRTAYEDFVLEMYRSEHAPEFVFHSLQFRIYRLLLAGHNVVLSAPTSMGKSAIVDALLANGGYRRIVIVVPTIALIDETRRRISAKFSEHYDVIHHTSQVPRKKKNTVYILTQERVNERQDIKNIDLFIIDEFYKLAFHGAPDERAIALNIALSKLLVASKQFYMIGPNIDEIRGLGNFNKKYYFIPANFNTVAVNVSEYNIKPNDEPGKRSCLLNILEADRKKKGGQGQTIIYCKSPHAAAEIARFLASALASSELDSGYVKWVCKNYSSYWSYSIAISNGIGIHHGALPRAIQQHTVEMFNRKEISVLICTSTIIEGVNTNAENVIIYDNRNGVGSIDRFTHNNIKGRAGRMKVHFVGNVHCLETVPVDTLASRVVDIPLGMQDESIPFNMLAGIDPGHIDPIVAERYETFLSSNLVPIWMLKKHSSFHTDQLKELVEFVEKLDVSDFRTLCFSGFPNASAVELICVALRLIATPSLRNSSLHFDSEELKNKFTAYLFAKTHQDYVSAAIAWLIENRAASEISDSIDRELKIIRNIFGFTIPKVLSLLEDTINFVREARAPNIQAAKFNLMMAIFENNHLPSNFAALEEMGIPIQTLEKIQSERLAKVELNVLVRYVSWHFNSFELFDDLDKDFVRNALLPSAKRTRVGPTLWQRVTD